MIEYSIKSKPTLHNGILFASQLEAKYAIYFDCIGLEYEYEPKTFDLGNGLIYTPDFFLKKSKSYVEVKPVKEFWSEIQNKLLLFSQHTESDITMLYGIPTALPMPHIHYFEDERKSKVSYDVIIMEKDSKYGGLFICGGDEDFTQEQPYFDAFMKANTPL